MSGSEKKKKQPNKLSKNTLGSFWKFHVVVVQNNVTEMYKKCAARAELLFRSLDPLLFFYLSRCFCRLALHDCLFCLSKL